MWWNMQQNNEIYLDRIVVAYILQSIELAIVQKVPEAQRPAVFLDRLGQSMKKEYIGDSLTAYLGEALGISMPDDTLYVFASNEVYKFHKRARVVDDYSSRKEKREKTVYSIEGIGLGTRRMGKMITKQL